MILPNKLFSYGDSDLPKFIVVLNQLNKKECTASELFKQISKEFKDVNDFIRILDELYLLNKVNINERGKLYVSWT